MLAIAETAMSRYSADLFNSGGGNWHFTDVIVDFLWASGTCVPRPAGSLDPFPPTCPLNYQEPWALIFARACYFSACLQVKPQQTPATTQGCSEVYFENFWECCNRGVGRWECGEPTIMFNYCVSVGITNRSEWTVLNTTLSVLHVIYFLTQVILLVFSFFLKITKVKLLHFKWYACFVVYLHYSYYGL